MLLLSALPRSFRSLGRHATSLCTSPTTCSAVLCTRTQHNAYVPAQLTFVSRAVHNYTFANSTTLGLGAGIDLRGLLLLRFAFVFGPLADLTTATPQKHTPLSVSEGCGLTILELHAQHVVRHTRRDRSCTANSVWASLVSSPWRVQTALEI